jgi:hypothetical protein
MQVRLFGLAMAAALAMLPGLALADRMPDPSPETAAAIDLDDLALAEPRGGYAYFTRHGFRPRNDMTPIVLRLPLDWDQDPFDDPNWRFQLHAWRMMDPILAEYGRTGDARLLAEASAFALDWARYHYVRGHTAEFSWDDMATGIRALKLAYFHRKITAGELVPSDEESKLFERLLADHADRLQNRLAYRFTNHTIYQVYGLQRLCSELRERAYCRQGRDFAAAMFPILLERQLTAEGIHREHSPSYHLLALSFIQRLGGHDAFADSDVDLDRLTRAEANQDWLIQPDQTVVAAGDSAGREAPTMGLPPARTCLAADRCFAVGDFSRSGYAIVRSDPAIEASAQSMLFVTGMAYSSTHKHADDLSFTLYEGRPVLIDSGKYAYKSDEIRRYVVSADAHNTVGLADRRIMPRDTAPYGSALQPVRHDEREFLIEGFVAGRAGLFDHRRRLRYRPGEYLVVTDELEAGQELDFVSRLHVAHDLTVEPVAGGFAIDLGPRQVRGELRSEGCELRLARGEEEPSRLGWESVAYGKMTPATVIEAHCPGIERRIEWSISLQDRAAALP